MNAADRLPFVLTRETREPSLEIKPGETQRFTMYPIVTGALILLPLKEGVRVASCRVAGVDIVGMGGGREVAVKEGQPIEIELLNHLRHSPISEQPVFRGGDSSDGVLYGMSPAASLEEIGTFAVVGHLTVEREAPRRFRWDRLVIESANMDRLLVEDIRIGKQSRLGWGVSILATHFMVERSPVVPFGIVEAGQLVALSLAGTNERVSAWAEGEYVE